MPMYAIITFITVSLVTYVSCIKQLLIVTNGLYNDSLLLCRFVSMTVFNFKTMSTNYADYRCHIEVVKLFSQSYGVQIMPLVIYSLGGGHTHTHKHTHMHACIPMSYSN